jgi:hypothetical protein
MFRNVSCWQRWPSVWPVGLLVATFLALPGPAAAQAGKPAATPPPEQARLKQAIEARFRVLPVQKGILLVPRVSRPGVGSIELSDGTIAVNGTLVTGAELKQRLGSDADLVAELSYLGQAAREALFFGGSPPAPEAPAPPPAPEANPPEPSPPPESPSVERQFSRRSSARVRVGGAIHVDRDESVDGAVVVILGSAVIDGQVRDAVVVVGGNARLGADADVRGDVTVVGGTIDRDPGARVSGEVNEIAFGSPPIHLRPLRRPFWRLHPLWLDWATPPINLFGTLLRLVLFGLLAGLVMLVAGDPVERIEHAAASEPWKAGLVGLLAELLFVPLLVLTVIILAISIIGIPLLLLVPFALLALLAALLLGFTGVAFRVGRWAQQRFGWGRQSRYVLLAAGLGMVWGLTVLGRIVALGGWPVWILSAGLIGVGFLVEYVAWTVGLGATLLSRFGTRGARPAMVYGDTAPPPAQPGGDIIPGTSEPV